MNEPQKSFPAARQCARCGAELPGNLPGELCPGCLLQAGLSPHPQTGPPPTVIVPPENFLPGLPGPGELFGHYRILRPLGGGGMGMVFEAEDLENGRHVALKALRQALDSPEARQRFFREGRLAASINHPNSVYVFGSEEIAGSPVITMELVAGGTLEDRVRAAGPLPPAQAVDAALQIIAGLEAAQRTGILHRDVKPSNCFVDVGGAVKIGDFGLSISTALRMETSLTAAGSFLGTPAFCSPEQLRGEELNARADIYSVGATLFYLLTGRTPFEAKNVVALIATVLEQPAPSLRQFQPKLPRGLARITRRCLEKQPGERFANYQELRKALIPYSSTAPVPATLGLRFAAGILDSILTFMLGIIISMAAVSLKTHSPFAFLNFSGQINRNLPQPALISVGIWIAWTLYYALPEGIWGGTPGKFACGLRVVGQDNRPPGLLRALTRALIYLIGTSVLEILVYGPDVVTNPSITFNSSWGKNLLASSDYVVLLLLFSTMRRRNGFAAIHDLVTRTRVVSKLALQARPSATIRAVPPPAVEANPLIGPYHVLDTIEESRGFAWLLGYDLRLLRKVWIRTAPPSSPPVPAQLRNLARIGRLRWLAGRRSSTENWDAFEAVTGQPLLQLLQQGQQRTTGKDPSPVSPQPWTQVRYWLSDLATELSAAEKDGSFPSRLALDRVWITGDGHAKLLDFPLPGLPSSAADVIVPPISDSSAAPRFLTQVAAAALQGRPEGAVNLAGEIPVPLPLHARQFFKDLPPLKNADASLLTLQPLLQRVAEVTRRRRAAIVAACLVFPLSIASIIFFVGMFLKHWTSQNAGISELGGLLQYRAEMQSMDRANFPVPTDRQFAIYIAGKFRPGVTNTPAWADARSLTLIDEQGARFAQESFNRYPAPSSNEVAEANAALIESRCICLFSADDIKNWPLFADRLIKQSDPVSAFIWQSLSREDQTIVQNFQSSASSSSRARDSVVVALNQISATPSIYQAERFKDVVLRPETTWFMKQSPTNTALANINRCFLNRSLLEDAYPSALAKGQFTTALGGLATPLKEPTFAWIALVVTLTMFVCLPALIAALAFRGGLVLLVTGVTYVRRDGAPASRLRLFWRSLVTWCFLLAAIAFNSNGSTLQPEFAIVLFCALAVLSVALPQRGLQDRLAGTWPVPR